MLEVVGNMLHMELFSMGPIHWMEIRWATKGTLVFVSKGLSWKMLTKCINWLVIDKMNHRFASDIDRGFATKNHLTALRKDKK